MREIEFVCMVRGARIRMFYCLYVFQKCVYKREKGAIKTILIINPYNSFIVIGIAILYCK